MKSESPKPNAELLAMFEADQADRSSDETDWEAVSARDEQRHDRVLEIVEAGEATLAVDWFYAAMIMQHGQALEDYERAHEWAKKAAELDPTMKVARWLAAAAKDRWLMSQGKPQLYGTQFTEEDGRWVLYEVDPSIDDEERARWNVPPLAEARAQAEAMNED